MLSNKRKTRIIATIGPATESPEMLEQMILAGMNIARINMSHASEEQVRHLVSTIRELEIKLKRQVGILMDTQGPAIRTGDLSTHLDLTPGERIVLTVRGATCEEYSSVDVNYDNLIEDIAIDDTVLVDNGEIQLKVLEKRLNQLHCQVLTEGTLGSRRHINLPGVRVNLPALTEKDLRDVDLGIEMEVDFFAMSFVREPADIMRLKAILDYRNSPQKVIAKLEDQEGIRNLDDIIDAADGIMVARGDLGIECPYEELPIIQRKIVKNCMQKGKPVIVATHMLESMIESPSPTRAEITDVANAVFEQADAIMLSGETSVGAYPVKCLDVMDRIATRIERSGGAGYASSAEMPNDVCRLVRSACRLADDVNASALIVFTDDGRIAQQASWMRPECGPIFAFTANRKILNQLVILWGTEAFFLDEADQPPENVELAIEILKEKKLILQGQTVVAVTEVHLRDKLIDTIQMELVD